MQITEECRKEALHHMGHGFPAMARALIAFDIAGQLMAKGRADCLRRNSSGRLRILSGENEGAVYSEARMTLRDEMIEQRRLADEAWDEFVESWLDRSAS